MKEQLLELWSQLDLRQRVVLGAVALVTLGALVALGVWASRPAYEVLYSGLQPGDGSAVVEQLKSQKVPYRLSQGGTAIEVPRDRVYQARLDLAAKGLPQGGAVGFEIFDRSGLPGTEFTNNISYQRALQGELTRTIEEVDQVKWARVHLVIPQPTLFTEEQTPPTASVLIGLAPGRELSPQQVRAIIHLVASAVDKLTPENITVLDSGGNLLASGADSHEEAQPGALTLGQLQAQREVEDELRKRVQTMLDHTLGPGRSIVRVRAELDFDVQETKSETIEPAAAGEAPMRRETSEEKYSGQGRGAAGVPGVTSNLGGGAFSTTSGEGGAFSSKQEKVEYEHSRRTETRHKAPGAMRRMSVAAIVDEAVPGADLRNLEALIAAAAGADQNRGDTVTVRTMKLEAVALAEAEAKKAAEAARGQQRHSQVMALIRHAALVLAGLLMLGYVARTTRGPRPAVAPDLGAVGRLPAPSFGPEGAGESFPDALDEGSVLISDRHTSPLLPQEEMLPTAAASGAETRLMELTSDDAQRVARALQRLMRGR